MLSRLLAERVAWVTEGSASEPDTSVVVLLRSLDLADFVCGARIFAASLDAEEARYWRRSFTRTRFLFGNPVNLAATRVIAPNETAAWLGPFPSDRLPGQTRLLKPVTGTLPALPSDVDIAGTGATRMLHMATSGLTLVDYLVHLHHTLAEAVLLGRLRPDEPVRLHHRPELEPGLGSPAYARVLPEPGDDRRLRLHTWLF